MTQPYNLYNLAGSLADREHRKWVEKAVPLSNNPYNMENITRRRRMSLQGEDSIVTLRYSKEVSMKLCSMSTSNPTSTVINQ